jgi:uncharacterized membrane protein YoaK (UPF0700 family)
MLSARAYSFRQKSRLAISLSWIGGYTNVIGLLAFGTVVSHVTGTATQLGRWIAAGDFRQLMFYALLLFTFFFGAALSGFLTETARRRGWRSIFVFPLVVEAVLLSALMAMLFARETHLAEPRVYAMVALAAIAMGLQNATITRISGAVVRTTHLTGIFTDLGLEGMQYLFWWKDELCKRRQARLGRLFKVARRHPEALRLALLLSIAGSFGLGVVLGTLAFSHLNATALVAPIMFLFWIVFVDWRSPIADIREMDVLNDPELRFEGSMGNLLPMEVVLYRATYQQGRRANAHRGPNFQLWLDRIPPACRVVVLALSPLTCFDANTVLDLEAAVKHLHDDNKKLVLSGISSAQFKALDELGVARMMDISNICPDLEFAIARAIAVTENMKEAGGLVKRPESANVAD